MADTKAEKSGLLVKKIHKIDRRSKRAYKLLAGKDETGKACAKAVEKITPHLAVLVGELDLNDMTPKEKGSLIQAMDQQNDLALFYGKLPCISFLKLKMG